MRAKQVKSRKEKVTADNMAERSEKFKWLLNSEVGNGLPVAAAVTVATVALVRARLEEGQDWAPGRGQGGPGGQKDGLQGEPGRASRCMWTHSGRGDSLSRTKGPGGEGGSRGDSASAMPLQTPGPAFGSSALACRVASLQKPRGQNGACLGQTFFSLGAHPSDSEVPGRKRSVSRCTSCWDASRLPLRS